MTRRLIVLVLFGCGGRFYPADRGRMIEQRLDKLVEQTKKQEAQLKDDDTRQAEMIGQVQKALESLDKAAHRSDADIGVQLQKTVEDVAMLRGQVETYQYKVTDLETALKGVNDELAKKATDAEAVKQVDAKK